MNRKTKAEKIAEILYAGIVRFVKDKRAHEKASKKVVDFYPNWRNNDDVVIKCDCRRKGIKNAK